MRAGLRLGSLVLVAALATSACSDLAGPLEPMPDGAASVLPASAAFTEDFTTLDGGVWVRSAHTLGRGPLMPGNVTVSEGRAVLRAIRSGFEGAEIHTVATWGAGSFTARARCASPRGTVCAFFLYQTGVGDAADEIDIEIISGTREIWFTTWVAGRRTSAAKKVLAFDPAQEFHTYTIVRNAGDIRFLVDGRQLHSMKGKGKVPQAAMPLFANTWWPTWLTPSDADGTWEIDRIEVR